MLTLARAVTLTFGERPGTTRVKTSRGSVPMSAPVRAPLGRGRVITVGRFIAAAAVSSRSGVSSRKNL
eukprot:385970-Prymnesium_polylepis.1